MGNAISDIDRGFIEIDMVDSVPVFRCLTCDKVYCGDDEFNFCPRCGVKFTEEVTSRG